MTSGNDNPLVLRRVRIRTHDLKVDCRILKRKRNELTGIGWQTLDNRFVVQISRHRQQLFDHQPGWQRNGRSAHRSSATPNSLK
ncbi:hypothetical protein D9M71_480230 [compost metagenome]